MANLHMRRCQPSECREVVEWIKENHYLRSAPPGFVDVFEFAEVKRRIGAMMLGRPCARSYDPNRILELPRVYFVDETEPFVESQGLAMMRKYVRIWMPRIRLLISYSDPSRGHEGTIYEADGWAPLGMTQGTQGRQSNWKSREGRRVEEHYSRKQRWVRTP